MNRYSLTTIERALGLPMMYLSNEENLELPGTKALIKIIKTFPWMIEVADNNFDSEIAKKELVKAAIDAGLLNKEE